jgi:hypothetical protein
LPDVPASSNLVALDKAVEAAGAAIALAMRVRAPLKSIFDGPEVRAQGLTTQASLGAKIPTIQTLTHNPGAEDRDALNRF